MRWLYNKLFILLGYIICFVFEEKEDEEMRIKNWVLFYVNLLIEGKITFEEVPQKLKSRVKQVAIDLGMWEIIEKGVEDTHSNGEETTQE